jgi:hypothetical protein
MKGTSDGKRLAGSDGDQVGKEDVGSDDGCHDGSKLGSMVEGK